MTISWVEAISAGDHIRGRLSGKMACYNVYTTGDGAVGHAGGARTEILDELLHGD